LVADGSVGADSKVMSLGEAASLVRDGDHLALSGFACARNAVAFSHELIRQRRRDLVLSACILGMDADLLVGAGCVRRVIYGGGSLDRFGQLQRVNEAIEQGRLEVEYTSSLAVCFRYLAGALGLPCVPIKSLLGSDMLAELAETTRELECPFTGEPLLLLRALQPDVAVVHVQMADAEGNARLLGPRWDNNEAVKAARQVIVVTEDLVPTELIRRQPELTLVPGFRVSAVVPLAYGAHPTSVYGCYDYDAEHLTRYVAQTRTQAGFDDYLAEFVLEPGDHLAYLEKIGGIRALAPLRADPALGY
jgi:acyl CoA:acetate/3-ketoacid CoA transferase alpha subunit